MERANLRSPNDPIRSKVQLFLTKKAIAIRLSILDGVDVESD
ncbi:MAG: hypothetical protein AAFO04_11425 [Cyanobacteria bacterium J06592_8]